MTPDGFETLALVREYLATEVAPALPDHIATEVKAVVKLLDTVSAEFAALDAILPVEIAELRSLCQEGLAALGELDEGPDGLAKEAQQVCEASRHASEGAADLQDLLTEQRRFGGLSAVLIGRLQARVANSTESDLVRSASRDLLVRFFETLGRQAHRRTPWQSVFPHAAPASKPIPPGESSK